ncbi:MAG: metal-dependent hydrolase [Alphaproteobacteria bacterium]|nr:metal-dependent hydrolase [Alphaproteobacteria bacterium]
MSALAKALVAIMLTARFLIPEAVLAEQVEVLWLGHSTIRITSVEGKVILIDPFLTKNPSTPAQYKDLAALGKVDLILVTHSHIDHVGDLAEVARRSGATVVANYELTLQWVALGLLDGDKVIGMNTGGTVAPLGRGIKIHMVPAEHSSSINVEFQGIEREPGSPRHLYTGAAVGYVVELENGFKIYNSGDTTMFGDMALINRFYAPDLALVSIGGHFTMDPEGAAYAVRELIKPKQVIPVHYGTYPVINRTPAEFKAALGDTDIEVLVMQPGEALKF